MAGISAIQRLLDNALTSKFARSLKHSDLPEGWADNPEIVGLAEEAYKEMGTESPFFKAWFGNSKVVDEDGLPLPVYHGTTENFDVFDPTKSRASMDIQGSFFSPWRDDARGYGANVREFYLSFQNPANSSTAYNSLKAHRGENYAGVSAREDLKKAGYDSVDGDGEEYIAFASPQIKLSSNRGTFNPDDPNISRGLIPVVGAGGMFGLLTAEDAEAAPAVKDFAKKYAKAVNEGDKRMMYAGSLEPNVFEAAAKKDRELQNNRVFMGPHGGEARLATGEMEPEEVGRHVENLLNSGDTRVLPNFPSNNYRNNTKNMLYLNDGKDIVAPFIAGKSGDVVLRTAFEPQKDRMKFIDGLLGRPKAPISGLRNKPASAQPQGLSVVSEPSSEDTIPSSSSSRKSIIPLTVGGVLLPTTADAEGDADHSFWPEMARQFGLGTRGVLEGLGSGATLGFGDPGRVIADIIGLPIPETDIERRRVGFNSGVADGLAAYATGAGAARMAANPVVRGVGMELADRPLLGAGIGGLLGLLSYGEED